MSLLSIVPSNVRAGSTGDAGDFCGHTLTYQKMVAHADEMDPDYLPKILQNALYKEKWGFYRQGSNAPLDTRFEVNKIKMETSNIAGCTNTS